MRNITGLLFGYAMLGIVSSGSAGAADCSGVVTAGEAIAAEDARYAAQTREDFAAMEKLFGEDLVYIHSSALVDGKASYIELMRSGEVHYRVMKRDEVTVRTYGCVAIITGHANFDVTVKGKDVSVELRFHSIWAKRDGGLQFISWQATRVPPKT
jgi:ketosteroid isomerase-like protein